MRKYEIHLPLTYGNDEPIDAEKIRDAREELIAKFGSAFAPNLRTWRYDGRQCVEVMRIEIVTVVDRIPRKFLKDFKERLKESLQIDILITIHRLQST